MINIQSGPEIFGHKHQSNTWFNWTIGCWAFSLHISYLIPFKRGEMALNWDFNLEVGKVNPQYEIRVSFSVKEDKSSSGKKKSKPSQQGDGKGQGHAKQVWGMPQEALHVQWAMQEHSSQLSVSLKNRKARFELAKKVSKEHVWFWNNILWTDDIMVTLYQKSVEKRRRGQWNTAGRSTGYWWFRRHKQ